MTRRCTDCGQRFTPARDYHVRCWDCWHAQSKATPGLPALRLVPVLDARTLREAVALSHPDLHPPERQERALRLTQALTAALDRTRALERAS